MVLLAAFAVAGTAWGAESTGGGRKMVLIETSLGNIKVELNAEKAPISAKNFLEYAKAGHYDGTVFHRVIKGFMVQGGGLTPEMSEKGSSRPPIKNEAANGLKNERGTVAMARTMIVDSATAQFFINTVNNPFLDHRDGSAGGFGYAVFGKVVEGMDVVDKIESTPTGRVKGFQDVPLSPVKILKVKVLEQM
jgi:peptidyl-prolyl cis-trans isomerase A (cyclophilin A)